MSALPNLRLVSQGVKGIGDAIANNPRLPCYPSSTGGIWGNLPGKYRVDTICYNNDALESNNSFTQLWWKEWWSFTHICPYQELLLAGCFIDPITIMLLTVPLFVPVIVTLSDDERGEHFKKVVDELKREYQNIRKVRR